MKSDPIAKNLKLAKPWQGFSSKEREGGGRRRL